MVLKCPSTKSRRLDLPINAQESDEEKEAGAQYGSSDSADSLGDVLGAALKCNRQGAL